MFCSAGVHGVAIQPVRLLRRHLQYPGVRPRLSGSHADNQICS